MRRNRTDEAQGPVRAERLGGHIAVQYSACLLADTTGRSPIPIVYQMESDYSENQKRKVKQHMMVLQGIGQIDADAVHNLLSILNGTPHLSGLLLAYTRKDVKNDHGDLERRFRPWKHRVPIGDVFLSCNWLLREQYGPPPLLFGPSQTANACHIVHPIALPNVSSSSQTKTIPMMATHNSTGWRSRTSPFVSLSLSLDSLSSRA